jgi:hypothetical protein
LVGKAFDLAQGYTLTALGHFGTGSGENAVEMQGKSLWFKYSDERANNPTLIAPTAAQSEWGTHAWTPDICHMRLLTKRTAGAGHLGRCWRSQEGFMATPGTQFPNQNPGQVPRAVCADHASSHIVMGLGVVLLCFGAAITGQHEVTMIGLAMIVFSSWLD